MATRPVRQIVQVFGRGAREDALAAPAQDGHAWTFAESIAEKHIAGWLFYLAGRAVPEFELATSVRVEGLTRRKPHANGSYTWQTEGGALLIATNMDASALEVYLSDYRTAQGRVDRARSASSQRAASICAAIESGVSPRDAIAAHKLPSVKRQVAAPRTPSHNDDSAALAYYRQLVASGDIV